MEYPKTWDAANDKLKKLFPNSIERGRVKRKLLAIIDLDQRLEYFQDDDESVRAMLAPERASTSIHEIPSVGSRTEGINARRRVNIYTPRVESVTKLCEVLLYRNAVLIRSAPATGKTSMLQLVATHLKERYGDEVRVVHFSLQGYDPDDPASFEKLWNEQHPNTDFNSTVSPHSSPTKGAASQQQPVTVLTVDEAQKAFMHPHLKPFEKVKYIQGLEHSNLKILLVSSWGSNIVDVRDALSGAYSTPGSWDASNTVTCWYNPTIGLGLQLTMEESEEYWRAWVEANGWSGFESTAGEMMYLVDLTQRQPGAFSLLLDRIGDQGWQHLAESEWHRRMQLYLMSEKPIMAMQDLRSLQRIVGSINEEPSPSGLTKDLLRELLQRGGEGVDKSLLNPTALELAQRYTRWGQLVFEGDAYQLPSRLHYLYLTRQLFSGSSTIATIQSEGLLPLLVNVIEHFNKNELCKSLSRRAVWEPVYERLYQNLFYYETRRYVPVEVTISPDVGWLFGSKGYLDFVLGAPLHYAVEIMREGKDPEGHLSRFAEGGRYANLLHRAGIQEWAVIDFRSSAGRSAPTPIPGMVYVVFGADYEFAEISNGQFTKTVAIKGPL